jgi:hypothetical protein
MIENLGHLTLYFLNITGLISLKTVNKHEEKK